MEVQGLRCLKCTFESREWSETTIIDQRHAPLLPAAVPERPSWCYGVVSVVGVNLPAVCPLPQDDRNASKLYMLFLRGTLVCQRTEDCVEDHVELLVDIFDEEPQDEVAVLLEQKIFAAVTAVGVGTVKMLGTVEFDGNSPVGAQ